MEGTIDALGYKADVPARTKDKMSGAVSSVKEKVVGAADTVSDATPSGDEVTARAKRAVGVAQENPIGLAIGSVAAGFLIGMALPRTRVEDEHIGPVADTVKQQAVETGQEAMERGKQVAQETAQTAAKTAKQKASAHADDMRESVQEHAGEVRDQVQSSS
jgi:tetrahydromethanopterin S-methyltransferase subunit F